MQVPISDAHHNPKMPTSPIAKATGNPKNKGNNIKSIIRMPIVVRSTSIGKVFSSQGKTMNAIAIMNTKNIPRPGRFKWLCNLFRLFIKSMIKTRPIKAQPTRKMKLEFK